MNLIKSLKIGWLSPERIKKISFSDNKTLGTDNFMINSSKVINIRTFKPELGGLFDPRIFGPFLNYECYCGKYKGKENKGQKCERCEVLITEKNIQRWRIGHVTLASPVTNLILFKNLAINLSKILEIPTKSLEDIIYFRVYVVVDNGLTNLLKKKEILEKKIDPNLISGILQEVIKNKKLSENIITQAKELEKGLIEKADTEANTVFLEDYLDFLEKNWKVKIWTGTKAFRELLHAINVEEELKKIKNINKKGSQKTSNEKIRFLRALQKTGTKLEWMVINDLPVIPCGLRPVTKLKDKDTIATAQITNLYYKVILINERLNYYLDLNKEMGVFFNEIIHNEKRRLQKAVDQLLYGSPRQQAEVKSLLQNLSGKEGILRRYSLGKRVDYSARSVIVPNPTLLLDQIGIPIRMALVLYKQFIIQKVLKEKIAFTVKEAEQLLLNEAPIIFTLLNEVIQNHPVLANRAPSLHRLSIQGFYPQLTLGNSIELHPLITTALNADFDGDQIAIHLPLSKKSREEIKKYVLSPQHIIDPKNGHLIDVPNQDMILGIYYLTKENKQKRCAYYDEIGSIWRSYNKNEINLHDLIIIPACLVGRNFSNVKNQFLFTTLGKLIFNQILPPNFPSYLNNLEEYNEEKDQYKEIVVEIEKIEEKRKKCLPLKGWKKKDIISFLNKLARTTSRREMVEFLDKLKKLSFDYVTHSGISISPFELGEVIFKEKALKQSEEKIKQVDEYYSQGFYSKEESKQKKNNIWEQCKKDLQEQLISNLEKKNNTSFYHIWDSGARASSENLVQLFVMRGHATNYLGEIIETPITSSLWEGLSPFEFFTSVYGAVKGMIDISLKTAAAGDLTRRLVESSQSISIVSPDCQTTAGILLEENNTLSLAERIYGRYLAHDTPNKKKEIILTRNTLLLEKELEKIEENKISSVWVRSPLKCELVDGICQKCYGSDLSRPGETIAMGVAVGIIAAQSLGEPGTQLTMNTFHVGGIAGEEEDITQGLPKVKQIFDNVKPKKEEKAVLAKATGEIISIEETVIKQRNKEGEEVIYPKDKEKITQINQGDKIEKGGKIIAGKIDLEEYLEIMGLEICQNHIGEEIRKVYNNQGIDINEKHIEIFARQMLSRVEITDSGDSDYLPGDIEIYQQIQKINQSLVANKKKPVSFKNIISSLKDLASSPKSFLAGISFQNTLKSLINYSLYQPVDYLKGSKESLIAGQLIPVGTGFSEREKVLKDVINKTE